MLGKSPKHDELGRKIAATVAELKINGERGKKLMKGRQTYREVVKYYQTETYGRLVFDLEDLFALKLIPRKEEEYLDEYDQDLRECIEGPDERTRHTVFVRAM